MTTHCLALLLPWSQESGSGSSRLKGNYSCFSVVCALTFHSHRDDKFLPGCTLTSVTFPALSFARSAAAACFRHL